MQNDEKKEFISDIVGKISNARDEDYTEGMPTFDLGGQILAQHRKIAAMKRKSPGSGAPVPVTAEKVQSPKSTPIQIKPFQSMIEQPPSPQQRIIADIIAREIKVLTSATR